MHCECIEACIVHCVCIAVAVGTGIAPRPPHGSVQAELPHTALTSDTWRESAQTGKGVQSVHVEPIYR